MTEQLNETPKNNRNETRQLSISIDQKLKVNSQVSDNLENDYQFFRKLVKNNIFLLTDISGTSNIIKFFVHKSITIIILYSFVFVWSHFSLDSDQRAFSTWLCKCDEERDKSLKCGFIKLMLVSLQHPCGNMKLFRHSAPKNLPYLVNTPNHVSVLYTYI